MNNQETINADTGFFKTLKSEWYLVLFILGTLAFGLYLYPQLPDKVPSHWNFNGEIDGWTAKSSAVWFYPLINLGLYFLMILLPKIDPKRGNYARFTRTYRVFRIILVIFLAFLYLTTLFTALGFPINVSLIVKFSISILFIILGNYMGKIKPNYFLVSKLPGPLPAKKYG